MNIVSTYEHVLPISQADAEVVVNTAAALARRGHRVRLLTPGGAGAASAQEVRQYYGVHGDLEVEVCDTPAWSGALAQLITGETLERGRQHLTHAVTLPGAVGGDVDVVYTRHLPLAFHALRAGHRVFFDHYRPWGDQVPPMQLLIRAVAGHPNFVGMVTHSAVAAEAYRRIGVPADAVEVRHNGFDPDRMKPVLTQNEARQQLGLEEGRPTVVYTGRINEKKGLGVVLSMARALPETQFVLVGSEGNGPIEQQAAQLPNVRIVGWQTFEGTAPYLYAADVLIIPPSADPLKEFGSTVLPLKVYLYLAAGRTIFAAGTPDIREVLNETNSCLVEPGDAAGAADALRDLVQDRARMDALGAGATRTAAELTWDKRAARIEVFLDKRLASAPSPLSAGWSYRAWLTECARWMSTGFRTGRWFQGGISP